jgi:hypothetical protein
MGGLGQQCTEQALHCVEMRTIKSTESRECSKAIKKIITSISTDVIRDGLIPVLIDIGGIVPAGKK